MEIPTKKDFERLEAKVDQLLKLLHAPVAPVSIPSRDDDLFPYRTREWLLEKLSISKTRLLELEKEEHFTPIKRGAKTYYHTDQIREYMKVKNYRADAIERKMKS